MPKVNIQKKQATMPLYDIDKGEYFCFPDNIGIYMKCEEVTDLTDDSLCNVVKILNSTDHSNIGDIEAWSIHAGVIKLIMTDVCFREC